MKKIITFIILCILCITPVKADKNETEKFKDITNDIEIRYKWYKEERVDGVYHKKGEVLEGYYEDETIKKYGKESELSEDNCTYSKTNYIITEKYANTYEITAPNRYIKLTNYDNPDNIKIYHNKTLINFVVVSQSETELILDMQKEYPSEEIWFYIKYEAPYDIELAEDKRFYRRSISKHVDGEEILIPDKTWITEKTKKYNHYTGEDYEESDFRKLLSRIKICSVREILTYRYKIEKIYYDDNYHTYVEGYIKDENDFIVLYKGEQITTTIEITKIVKDKEIQYIETEPEIIIEQTECPPQEEKIVTNIEYREIEKEIKKIPKYIYILIVLLLLIIIIETIKIYKKKVD